MATIPRPTLTLKRSRGDRSGSRSDRVLPPPETRFWFVWCPTEERPKRRHATLAAAMSEARRLAMVAPGKRFLVYEARQSGNGATRPRERV